MLWTASEAAPEGNGPVPQKEELGSGQLTWGDVHRIMKVASDLWDKNLDEISDEMRKMDEHVSCLEHGARQPRLAMEADEPADTKTRERTEGAATAVQARRGDGYTAEQKVQDGPQTSISFGMMAEPPALPCREDGLVEEGATPPSRGRYACQQPLVAWFRPAKPPQPRRLPQTSHFFGSTRPRR